MIWQVGKMKKNVQLVVGEFPSFGDSQTRAIGTPDEGKTSWFAIRPAPFAALFSL